MSRTEDLSSHKQLRTQQLSPIRTRNNALLLKSNINYGQSINIGYRHGARSADAAENRTPLQPSASPSLGLYVDDNRHELSAILDFGDFESFRGIRSSSPRSHSSPPPVVRQPTSLSRPTLASKMTTHDDDDGEQLLQAAARGDAEDEQNEAEHLRIQRELLQQRIEKQTLAELEHRSRVEQFKQDNHRLEQDIIELEEDKRQCRRDREHIQEMRDVIHQTTAKSAIVTSSLQAQDKTRFISDSLIGPKPWTGLSSEDPESWLEIFTNYCNFRELKEPDCLRLMIILQQGAAGLWVHTLPTASKNSIAALVQAFKENYFRSPELKFQDASELWSRPQKATEPFNDYLTRLRRGANRLNINDEVLHYAVLNGLKPAVKSHILQQGVKTLQDTIKAARIAEATLSTDPISALLLEAIRVTQDSSEKQAQQIKDLTTKVSTLSAATLAPLHQSESVQAPINLNESAQTTRDPGGQQRDQPNLRQQQQRQGNTGNYQPRDYQPRFTRATPQNLQRANYGRNQAASRQNYNQQGQSSPMQANGSICVNCRFAHPAGTCPANQRQCFACGAYNHFARACNSVRRN